MASASNLSLIAAGIIALLAVFAFFSAVLTAQRGRAVAYYGARRETQQRANRRLVLSLALLLLAGILFASYFMMPADALLTHATPTTETTTRQAVEATSTSPPTNTAEPTPQETAGSPLPTPRLVPTVPPRATLIPEPASSLASPLPAPSIESSPAIVDPNKRLTLHAIASGSAEQGQPVGAGTSFPAGTPTIHVFYDYRDVPPGALLRQTWFRDGGSVYFNSQPINLNGEQNGAGMASVEWSPRAGFKPGLYEVRLQLGGVPQFVANFEVK